MDVSFAARLCSARKQCKMTQSEVAEKLQVSFQAVSLWERGETMPEMQKLPEIAELFHVTTDWLLSGKESTYIQVDPDELMSDRLFNEEKMYTYIKTYATVKGLSQTMRVLPYAREMHKEQYRSGNGKDRIPYINHPLMVACQALALGLDSDNVVSTALLHDVCEDCGVLPEELPVNEETREAVRLLTRVSSEIRHRDDMEKAYYEAIVENPIAVMVKLLDRCNNVSSMAAGFSKSKIQTYIENTEKWVYPLFKQARTLYPEYSNPVFLIKYHMTSVIDALKRHL